MSKNDEDWAPSLHDKLMPERSENAQERDKTAESRKRKRGTKGGRMKLLMLLEMLVMMTGIKKYRLSKLVML